VVAGAGYAGLHVALRLATKLRDNPGVELTLVDRHDYHQAITELPRVAGGTRAADAVRIPIQEVLAKRVRFIETEVTGFDLPGRRLRTRDGPVGWWRLVLALGSRPNDFAIPGLAERAMSLYSVDDAERVWQAVTQTIAQAAAATDPRWSWPASWPRCCPRSPAARAWRPSWRRCCWWRRAPPSWPAPRPR
jgi:NADH dehydrogenase